MRLFVPEHIINFVGSIAVLSGSGHVIDHRSAALKGIVPEGEMF
jgi:hypothetical protein